MYCPGVNGVKDGSTIVTSWKCKLAMATGISLPWKGFQSARRSIVIIPLAHVLNTLIILPQACFSGTTGARVTQPGPERRNRGPSDATLARRQAQWRCAAWKHQILYGIVAHSQCQVTVCCRAIPRVKKIIQAIFYSMEASFSSYTGHEQWSSMDCSLWQFIKLNEK